VRIGPVEAAALGRHRPLKLCHIRRVIVWVDLRVALEHAHVPQQATIDDIFGLIGAAHEHRPRRNKRRTQEPQGAIMIKFDPRVQPPDHPSWVGLIPRFVAWCFQILEWSAVVAALYFASEKTDSPVITSIAYVAQVLLLLHILLPVLNTNYQLVSSDTHPKLAWIINVIVGGITSGGTYILVQIAMNDLIKALVAATGA
jgi:hypothetical protein